jgi:hypothetical protein
MLRTLWLPPLRQTPLRLCGGAAALRPNPAAGHAAPREGAGGPPTAASSSPRTEQQPFPGAGAEWGSEASRTRRFRPRGAPARNVLNMATSPIIPGRGWTPSSL